MIRSIPPTYDVEDLRREVEQDDGVLVVVRDVASGEDLHERVARALDFPDHYGRNLDALNDCLRDTDPRTVVLWESWQTLAGTEPELFATASHLLEDRLTLLLPSD